MPTWLHIYPVAEFSKDENNNLKMKSCNGSLLLKFNNNSLMGFGRKLANMSELKHKRFVDGMKYLVKKRQAFG